MLSVNLCLVRQGEDFGFGRQYTRSPRHREKFTVVHLYLARITQLLLLYIC